jgi:hypothetical protein
MTDAQKSILSTLVHGGTLTAEQMSTQARLLGLKTRIAIGELRARGAIMPCKFGSARWQITTTGKALALAHGLGRTEPTT